MWRFCLSSTPQVTPTSSKSSKGTQPTGAHVEQAKVILEVQLTPGKKDLQDILRLLEEATVTGKTVKICAVQCAYLVKLFNQVGKCIQLWRGHGFLTGTTNLVAIEELAKAMDKGVSLMRSCQEQEWMIRSLIHEESRLEFTQLTMDILECLRLLSLALSSVVDVGQKKRVLIAPMQCLKEVFDLDGAMEDAASKDRVELWERVEKCKDNTMFHRVLLRKCAEAQSGIRENLFIDYKQLVLKRQLSRGAYGVVYDATWLDYPFAVKVFREGDISFSRELAALVPLKHPNIIRVVGYSYNDESRQCALVLEKMSMDLSKFLKAMKRDSRMSLLNAVSIMLDVATAMRVLHSENIIHRDLKPANILVNVGSNFMVKVADFGLARTKFVTKDVTAATSRVGTKAFCAPEVYDSDNYSKKADVYSYAMVSYQILTGETPFFNILDQRDFFDMVRMGRRPELPCTYPRQLNSLLTQCWSGAPEDRPDFWHICDILKAIKGCIVTNCTWDEVKLYEVTSESPGLHFFDGGGYNIETLRACTKMLGQGSLGITYQATTKLKGLVTTLAVKSLKEPKDTMMTKHQFQMLGNLKHINVLPLRSYYGGERECLLIYDYISSPSLETVLHGSSTAPLPWASRVHIALGIAKGLAYLHSQASLCGGGGFVHGNLHVSNILIHEGEAVITDAGVTYIVKPTAELTQATDTYAFGVLLIELLTKKAPGLVRYLLHNKRTIEVFDEELHPCWLGSLNKELTQLLRIAMACMSATSLKMERVVGFIEKLGVIRDGALPPGWVPF